MTQLLTAPCHGCHRTVRVEKIDGKVYVTERAHKSWRKHVCK